MSVNTNNNMNENITKSASPSKFNDVAIALVQQPTKEGKAALRIALTGLYNRQTENEQKIKSTVVQNGNGFYPRHAKILGHAAEFQMKNGRLPAGAYGFVASRVATYRRQITEIFAEIQNPGIPSL